MYCIEAIIPTAMQQQIQEIKKTHQSSGNHRSKKGSRATSNVQKSNFKFRLEAEA
jgi:hypothetical protein